MKYIEQPTGYLCGQACVAMLADVTVDEVITVMNNDKGTSKKQISDALNHYGINHAGKHSSRIHKNDHSKKE